mmetsp:Transcript_82014/g.228594  ORF Transcript_82014/g.228594 Transcript_82014/m.228594 type:complete len:223 (+) Transcript_82014:1209-1877(+)
MADWVCAVHGPGLGTVRGGGHWLWDGGRGSAAAAGPGFRHDPHDWLWGVRSGLPGPMASDAGYFRNEKVVETRVREAQDHREGEAGGHDLASRAWPSFRGRALLRHRKHLRVGPCHGVLPTWRLAAVAAGGGFAWPRARAHRKDRCRGDIGTRAPPLAGHRFPRPEARERGSRPGRSRKAYRLRPREADRGRSRRDSGGGKERRCLRSIHEDVLRLIRIHRA